jgi:hypothetical protein
MDEERESELLRKLEESKKWDKFYYGLMVAGVIIAIIGVYLEFSGILEEGGLAIAILGAGLSFVGGFINTARILSRIDFKLTLVCDAVRDEGKKTRREEKETREVLGKSLTEMGKSLTENGKAPRRNPGFIERREMNRKFALVIAICLIAALLVFPASAKRAELCPDRSPVKQDGTCDFPYKGFVPLEVRIWKR